MRIKEGLTLRTIGGEQIVMSQGKEYTDFGKLICLNKTAAFLWKQLLNQEFDAPMMAQLLTKQYEVTLDCALIDAELLCKEWETNGLIE